jgi:hypothetical protein
MFGKRKREKGRRMAEAVYPILDDLEARNWEWKVAVSEVGEEEASVRFPTLRLEHYVERMLPLCDGDPNTLLDVVTVWGEVRAEQFEARGEEERAGSLAGIHLGFLTGIGNLVGFIPEGALSYDEKLAYEGRRRGWRS